MDASAYAFVQGIRATRTALSDWNRRPGQVLRGWLLGSLIAAIALLVAVWLVAELFPSRGTIQLGRPPLVVGTWADVGRILFKNSLVLALHAMACVAGFIAGSSLPEQAAEHRGLLRLIYERGGRLAIMFVIVATGFSLSVQAAVLGTTVSRVAFTLGVSPALLLFALVPHAVPELVALFLPLAAWIIASWRGQWEQLLAATLVTVTLALPVLFLSALWEVFVAPHVLQRVLGY